MIINVRGTSGSGKTTIIRGIMGKGHVAPLWGAHPKKPEGYTINTGAGQTPIYIVGPYENVCGGCDAISTQDEICRRIRNYAVRGHVLVEGLLMSHVFSRYAAVAIQMQRKEIPMVFGFLDTPLETCLERVNARRTARGQLEPVDPTNTSDKWHANRSTFEKFGAKRSKDWRDVNKFLKEWGDKEVDFPYPVLDARWILHQQATETVWGWLQ